MFIFAMKKRKRNRMLRYDYSQNNLYFVTICVKNMECCFGEIHSAESESKSKKNIFKRNWRNYKSTMGLVRKLISPYKIAYIYNYTKSYSLYY